MGKRVEWEEVCSNEYLFNPFETDGNLEYLFKHYLISCKEMKLTEAEACKELHCLFIGGTPANLAPDGKANARYE